MKKLLFSALIATMLLAGLVVVAGANGQETCPNGGGWTKVDSDDLSLYPVDGATAYCFKLGSDNSEGCVGGLFETLPPNDTDVKYCGLSHWSYYIPPPVVVGLKLTFMQPCEPVEGEPAEARWRIRNPNSFAVAYTVDKAGTGQILSGDAPPGDSFFTTPWGAQTLILKWSGGQNTKAGGNSYNGTVCYEACKVPEEWVKGETVWDEWVFGGKGYPYTRVGTIVYTDPVDQSVCKTDKVYEEDWCLNLEGLQAEIPEGYVRPGRLCLPAPLPGVSNGSIVPDCTGITFEIDHATLYLKGPGASDFTAYTASGEVGPAAGEWAFYWEPGEGRQFPEGFVTRGTFTGTTCPPEEHKKTGPESLPLWAYGLGGLIGVASIGAAIRLRRRDA